MGEPITPNPTHPIFGFVLIEERKNGRAGEI